MTSDQLVFLLLCPLHYKLKVDYKKMAHKDLTKKEGEKEKIKRRINDL